jgi:hypothetical protein
MGIDEAAETDAGGSGAVADPAVLVLRRISPQQIAATPEGGIRISSGAFQNTSGTDGMSVVMEDTLRDEGRGAEELVAPYPGFGLVSLTAGLCVEEEQEVRRLPVDAEPAHGEVLGKKTKGRSRRFAAAADWVIRP